MRQYESYIQIIIIIIEKKDKIKREEMADIRASEEREIFYFFFLRFSLRSTEIGS